jgi:urease accessory protein
VELVNFLLDRRYFKYFKILVFSSLLIFGLLGLVLPVHAHHGLGGRLPQTGWEGLLSGLAHPVIGIDHLAFVVAMGVLASGFRLGASVPVGFVLATLIGTGLHLQSVDLPLPETAIALSVLGFGAGMTISRSQGWGSRMISTIFLLCMALLAGIFHGYAYGEAIIGAETSPLTAYLLGFMAIQGAIALAALFLSRWAAYSFPRQWNGLVRSLGWVVSGMGLVFLASSLGAA